MDMVDAIISNSNDPPVIILQGDHGSRAMLAEYSLENTNLEERMSILNAYYLPLNGQNKLYDNITPVNTFRIIFNHYFDTNLTLLKDENYFASWKYPYNFFDVTDKIEIDWQIYLDYLD